MITLDLDPHPGSHTVDARPVPSIRTVESNRRALQELMAGSPVREISEQVIVVLQKQLAALEKHIQATINTIMPLLLDLPGGSVALKETSSSRGQDQFPNIIEGMAEMSGDPELSFHNLVHQSNADENVLRIVKSFEAVEQEGSTSAVASADAGIKQ